MKFCGKAMVVGLCAAGVLLGVASLAQAPAPPVAGPHPKASSPSGKTPTGLDVGEIANGVYRNKTFGFSCKIPPGWVIRTDEMNAPAEEATKPDSPSHAASGAGAKVLLAAFSRPPEARAEDVNASLLIAAENISSYPGLKEAGQYLGPLTDVAQAQGFAPDEEPYETAVGTTNLARADFHKDVGTRVMHQSTLAMLSHGYAISITVIGGTEDEVEELIDGLNFTGTKK